ncbi:hypothetical protein V6N13_013821 [Hibiscus sabdariffa]
MINNHQFEADFFCNIRHLQINCHLDEANIFPFCFLQRFYSVEALEVGSWNFKELSPSEGDSGEDNDMITTLPKIKRLILDCVTNTRLLWTQEDHISSSLESLQVWHCPNLINLGSYFSTLQNLTTLDVWDCKEMTELITSSKAQSLVCLVTMRIRECETMREVVASQGDESTDEIVFEKLKYLDLHCLLSLKSFSSGNHTFRFPSLERVTVSQCPRINNFCQGVLSTPKLRRVLFRGTDFKERWAGDLNATVEQLYKEQGNFIPPPVAFEKARIDLQEEFQVHNYTRRPILPSGPKSCARVHASRCRGSMWIVHCGAVGFVVLNRLGSIDRWLI